jgi:lysyl-tRNA synthetase class 2
MSNISRIKKVKLEKLEALKKAGINSYPASTKRSAQISEAKKDFEKLSSAETELILAGRIMTKREHGGSTFCHINDGTESIQVYFKKDVVGSEEYTLFIDNFDMGDFLEVKGTLFLTRRGEKTLQVKSFKILAKALLPLPEKWHGLSDVEERYRKRYLDILMNSEIKEKFVKRSKIISAMRKFLDESGFLEVETPVLQTIPGGALAAPFKTHLNALDMDMYLRVAPELYLKRLLVAGFEKVYEIGRCFRNEGMDATHNPDFTMMECYAAYQDYNDFMEMTEKMIQYIVREVNEGSLELEYGQDEDKQKIDFKGPYKKIEFTELLKEHTGIDYDALTEEELFKKARELKVDVSEGSNKGKIADEIYKDFVRPKIIDPIFMINHPLELSPLAKQIPSNPKKVERFQVIVAGVEFVNAFSELNDPQEQEARFKEQEENIKKGDDEAMRTDREFIEALEYGMPPAAGLGLGVERLIALLTNSNAVREIILFPTMRPKTDSKTDQEEDEKQEKEKEEKTGK